MDTLMAQGWKQRAEFAPRISLKDVKNPCRRDEHEWGAKGTSGRCSVCGAMRSMPVGAYLFDRITMSAAELQIARTQIDAVPEPRSSNWTPTESYDHQVCSDCGYANGNHSRFCRGANA